MDFFEVKLFLQSSWFSQLQESIKMYDELIVKEGTDNKFDIESEAGQKACAEFLKSVQRLTQSVCISYTDRSYVEKFSKAYKILYSEDNTVYLPEIYDSAQEGYSYLWVNGEKYVFSDDVLKYGKKLKETFWNFKRELQNFETLFKYNIRSNIDFREARVELNEYLEDFDQTWAQYEK